MYKTKKLKKCIFLSIILIMTNIPLFASYEEALQLFREKKYDQSLKKVAEILVVANDMNTNSPNYKLRYLAAHNHWKLGNAESVNAHFKKCMIINKSTSDPYIDLALYQIEINKLNDAGQTARSGLKINKAPMLFYILGKIALLKKNYWKAKAMFEKTNSLDQELYISYHGLGIALMKLKKYSEANTAFSVAHALNPNSPEILNNIGSSFEILGKYKTAYKYYMKASEFDAYNLEIKQNIKRVKSKK